jgi:hypothetical protein
MSPQEPARPLRGALSNGGFAFRFRSLPAPGAVREGCHAAAFMDK